MRKVNIPKALATALAAGAVLGLTGAPPAAAEAVSGCETVPWGFLGGQRRNICDSVRHADGGWTRIRSVTRPAYYSYPHSSCSGGRYYSNCTYYPGGYVAEAVIESPTTYLVFDDNVVPGEPGHLENGFVA